MKGKNEHQFFFKENVCEVRSDEDILNIVTPKEEEEPSDGDSEDEVNAVGIIRPPTDVFSCVDGIRYWMLTTGVDASVHI